MSAAPGAVSGRCRVSVTGMRVTRWSMDVMPWAPGPSGGGGVGSYFSASQFRLLQEAGLVISLFSLQP